MSIFHFGLVREEWKSLDPRVVMVVWGTRDNESSRLRQSPPTMSVTPRAKAIPPRAPLEDGCKEHNNGINRSQITYCVRSVYVG